MESTKSPFDSLDEQVLRQVLLRCRASDFKALDSTCQRFHTILASPSFRQQRIQSEWAEARAVVWTPKQHALRERDPDDDVDDLLEENYDEYGYVIYPDMTSTNKIDLVVDNQKAGTATFHTVQRGTGCFFEACDNQCSDLEYVASNVFENDGAIAASATEVYEAVGEDDDCEGVLLYIQEFRWNEEYRNEDNSWLGANALRSFLTSAESPLSGIWAVCIYIPEKESQYSAGDRETFAFSDDHFLSIERPKPREHYQRMEQKTLRANELNEKDMQGFFRAGFSQATQFKLKATCRMVFAVPNFLDRDILTTQEARNITIPSENNPSPGEKDLLKSVMAICARARQCRATIQSHDVGGSKAEQLRKAEENAKSFVNLPASVTDSLNSMAADVGRLEYVVARVEGGETPFPDGNTVSMSVLNFTAQDFEPASIEKNLPRFKAEIGNTKNRIQRVREIASELPSEHTLMKSRFEKELNDAKEKLPVIDRKFREEVARFVNEIGVSVEGSFAIHACAECHEPEYLTVLLALVPEGKKQTALNCFDGDGVTPLMRASLSSGPNGESARLATIELLLQLGADKDMHDKQGHTALGKFRSMVPPESTSPSESKRVQSLLYPAGGPTSQDDTALEDARNKRRRLLRSFGLDTSNPAMMF